MKWQPPSDTDLKNGLETYFPAESPKPQPGVFELGLVLGGTVSAGAYTAGVLDFLIQALDAWDLALETQGAKKIPTHRVQIRIAGGASGGGVNAMLLGRIIPYSFTHGVIPQGGNAGANPFFKVWVDQFDIASMLDCSDLHGDNPVIASLLNVKPIDDAGGYLEKFTGHPLGEAGTNTPKARRWLADTYSVFLTLTNLKGVPYPIDFRGGAETSNLMSQTFYRHDDFVRFEFDGCRGIATAIRPDSFGISQWRNAPGMVTWSFAKDFAKATGAFPIGFRPRELTRPKDHYAWRVLLTPQPSGSEPRELLQPMWELMTSSDGTPDDKYKFQCVDGGTANNAPVEMVRTALAGCLGRNPRDGDSAIRSLLLIDPFANEALDPFAANNHGTPGNGNKTDQQGASDVLKLIMPLVGELVGQSRYETADLLLAADEKIFSRFMICGVKGDQIGSEALATSGLGAFQGFLCRDFRVHDYMLGRRNAYEFLKRQFVFPESNPVFSAINGTTGQPFWPDEIRTSDFTSKDANGATYLPMVPLFGSAATPPPVPTWPAGKLKPDDLREGIQNRIDVILKALENEEVKPGWFQRLYLGPVLKTIKGDLVDGAVNAIRKSLSKYKL